MAHNLDTTNGQTSFVSARQDAWHHLGTTLPSAFTAEDAMEQGLLGGWNVRTQPLYTHVKDDVVDEETGEITSKTSQVEIPNRFGVVRDNPVVPGQIDPLSVVGSAYHPIQNEAHAEFLNTLVDESGAHFETAGAIDGGRKVFITMKMPGHMKVGGVDQVDMYLAALNSHDGSLPFTVMVTPVRVVCENTLNIAWGGTDSKVKIRHTRHGGKSIVERARQTLDLSFDYLEGFQDEAEKLINTTMTQSSFEQIIEKAYGVDEDAPVSTMTRTSNKLDEMVRLFADAYTHEGLRDTAWAGLNALTEWNDHFTPVRNDDEQGQRSIKAVMDPNFKNRARNLIVAHAGI